MSAVRVVEILCDFPDCTDSVCDGERTNGNARAAAFLSGWRVQGGRDLCPMHIDATAEQIAAAGGES